MAPLDLITLPLILLAIFGPTFYMLDSRLDEMTVFEPAKLQAISVAAIAKHGDDLDPLLRSVVGGLQDAYPNVRIEDYDPAKWVFNVAGGATGSMQILHASLTEYVVIFGSATGTEGHSGVHLADDYFTILSGQQTAAFLGELRPRVYGPGEQHHHPRRTSAQYTLTNGTWALELAQGTIPAMLPFGLVQMPLAMDVGSLWRTVWYTGKNVVMNMVNGKL